MHNHKRVLMLIGRVGVGGGERVVLETLNSFNLQEFEVTLTPILGGGLWENQVPENIRLVPLTQVVAAERRQPFFTTLVRSFFCLPRLLKLASGNDVIIAAGEFGGPIYFGALASLLTGKPLIGWAHGEVFRMIFLERSWRSRVHRVLLPSAYRQATKILAVSGGVKENLIKYIRGIDQRVEVIYNPVDIDRARSLAAEPLPENIPKHLFDVPVVIGSGRTEYLKGFDLLIEAHAEVLKSGVKHHVAIMGPPATEDDALRKLAVELGVEKTVFFLGYQDNPFCVLKRSTIFVLPSRAEGLSIALIEAISLGLPSIASDCAGGSVETLGDGAFGIIMPNESAMCLAQSIEHLLLSPEDRKRFSMLAKERSEFFRTEAYMERLITAVNEVFSTDEGVY
jgi:glycosyltransferase involved in cell wall biosynthesis